MSQARRENKHYLANVDKGKEIAAILERKQRKGVAELEVPQRSYKQRLVQEVDKRDRNDDTVSTVSCGKSGKKQLSDSLLRKV